MQLLDNIAYNISDDKFNKAINHSLKYATISLPWTINRMAYKSQKKGIEKRLRNIVLGKIPEYVLWDFFKGCNLKVVSGAGETDYWEKDNFDFLLEINGNKEEWDVKSLSIDFTKLEKNDWMRLPALIPNRHKKDQWSKRKKIYLENSNCKRYIFVYLKNPGLKISLSEEQLAAFKDIFDNQKYYQSQADYILRKIGKIKLDYKKRDNCLVVSAVAGIEEFNLFKEIEMGTLFCGDLIKTRIENMGVEVGKLPSFLEIVGGNTSS